MKNIKIEKIIEDEIWAFLDKNDLSLYHIEFVKEGKDRYLRVFIDHKWSPGNDYDKVPGISTSECETVSRYLSDVLDKKEIIKDSFILEVSSPGMDRTLVTKEHYIMYDGREVEISLYKPIDGRKKISGKLGKLENDILNVTTDAGILLKLPMKSIAKTKLKILI